MKSKNLKPRVVVAGLRAESLDIEKKILAPLGCRLASGLAADDSSLLALCREASGIIVGSMSRLTSPVIGKLRACRIIARAGIGTDNIDLAAAEKKGIVVTRVPDYCIEEVSDHALAFILLFARKLNLGAEVVQQGEWGIAPLRPIHPLRGATLGVVGIGRIGAALARKARSLGMHLLAHDPFAPEAAFRRLRAKKVTLARLLKESDYISLHAPLTPKTKDMIGAAELKRMRPGAVLVNVARGELVKEKALAAALKKGNIRGAGLDVLAEEPPRKDNPLVELPNCVITPHCAWYSTASQEDLRRKAAGEVLRVLQGRKPRYGVV